MCKPKTTAASFRLNNSQPIFLYVSQGQFYRPQRLRSNCSKCPAQSVHDDRLNSRLTVSQYSSLHRFLQTFLSEVFVVYPVPLAAYGYIHTIFPDIQTGFP